MRHTRHAIRAAHATGHALVAAACGLVELLRYALTEAANTGRTLRIAYAKEGEPALVRDIAPEEVKRSKVGDWYVRATCLLRGERRNFRLDRITALETA
ncbi:WYL domain-containing protein [Streptomyces sioyaensis]|uniref:WYL domain-containing protein n=1 Tax=Streptomyces sioyaensis TaxID=67364 RepID=UPI0033F0670B